MPANTPTPTGLDLLEEIPYGAYAVDLDQTIRFWNQAAERITGHRPPDVIGRHCYEVVQNCPPNENEPWCRDGCPSLQAIRENRMPPMYEVRMLCASGHRKTVRLTPMVVPEPLSTETLLVYSLPRFGGRRATVPGRPNRRADNSRRQDGPQIRRTTDPKRTGGLDTHCPGHDPQGNSRRTPYQLSHRQETTPQTSAGNWEQPINSGCCEVPKESRLL